MASKLSPEDQARVDRVLESPVYGVERKPFRGWLLFWAIIGFNVLLGGLAFGLARLEGVI